MGHDLADAWTHPNVLDAMARIQCPRQRQRVWSPASTPATARSETPLAGWDFEMITLASESQALRKGAADPLGRSEGAEWPAANRRRGIPLNATESDRVALVTGAARGQGAAIVERLRRRRIPGRRLRRADRRLNSTTAACGTEHVLAVPLDVTLRRTVGGRGHHRDDRFGSLTTLVNNAGVLHRAAIADETAEGFEGSWRVNCLGPFLGIQAALATPPKRRRRVDRQHLQHRSAPPVPEPLRIRLVQVGAARADPDRRGRTGTVRHQGQRGLPRPGRNADARPRHPEPARRDGHHRPARQADGDRRRRRVPGVRTGVVHHRLGARRRRRTITSDRMTPMTTSPSVGIIGAGPGGLALGIFLKKAGFGDFTIFDREDGVGGTWRINTYPGLACDVKSHLYSFSFDTNANWSRLWSGQAEILAYFERSAQRYRLGPHLKLNTEVVAAQWDADSRTWRLTTSTGDGAHLRLRGVGRRALHPADDADAARGGAVLGHARAHGPLGPCAGSDGQERGGARHGFDCCATGSGGRQGRQEGLLHPTFADLDLAEARPGIHRAGEVGLRARPVRQEVPPNPDVAAQRVQHLGDRARQ